MSRLRPFVTIWGVRHGDDLYVRSAHGPDNPWFRRALQSGEGRIRAGGLERDVAVEEPGPDVADGITKVDHAKYDRYGPGPGRYRHHARSDPLDTQAGSALTSLVYLF